MSAWDNIVNDLLGYWPGHSNFIDKVKTQFYQNSIIHYLADSIFKLTKEDVQYFQKSYKWMCEMLLEEELYFCRYGTYRFSTFAEVNSLVYQNSDFMTRYMDGLLFSQILWSNHIQVFDFYLNEFLSLVKEAEAHLEIGPGHGLFLHYAAQNLQGTLQGWDISPSSLKKTADCLKKLGTDARVELMHRDISLFDTQKTAVFNSLVISEVLEHVEDPAGVLRSLIQFASEKAKFFINVPVNSPSIDHIYHFKAPEEVIQLVKEVGLTIEKVCLAPAACLTEAIARKRKSTISCAIIATHSSIK